MSFPASIVDYLQNEFLAETRPFCFLIDADHRLVESWGDGSWCGLGDLEAGDDMLAVAPYLLGSTAEQPQRYEFLETRPGAFVHLYALPEGARHFIVLLDATGEHRALRDKQQSVNELRLLHRQQHKLIGRQRELIAELVETRAELDHHRREAERSSHNKSQFIAMMSHEFRTPLASIINYAELAADESADEADVQKCIETITRSARHLTTLVEALLDDARLDAGQVELQSADFDLFRLLDELGAMMAPLAAEKGLSFATQVDGDVPGHVHADEVRLRQILINLLGNAIKFTVDGGVRLIVSFANGRLVATVSDTGPGISLEDQERVFQAFERGSQKSDSGAGLGLTITLRLAKLMGGEVALDSSPGEGCSVSVHVPVTRSSAAAAADVLAPPMKETYATQPHSVLILDDDEDMIALLEHYLHRAGYGVITTSHSSDAIAKAMKYEPELVLMDCNVPGISGIDAAGLLRRQGYAGPIVALTASKLSEADKSAFTVCFRKPAPMQELLGEIKRLTHTLA